MYENLFEASAAVYVPDGKKFETLCKRVKQRLVVLDYKEYADFVFDTGARAFALEIAHYLSQTRAEQDKIGGDVVGIFESIRTFYEDAELENAQAVAALSPEEKSAYQDRMVECLDADLKGMASYLVQLYMASKDEPIQKDALRRDLRPGPPYKFDI